MLSSINSRLNARLAITGLSVVLIVVYGLLSGCGKKLTEKDYIERAKDLQDKGDLRGSVIELKNALRTNPNSVESRWMLGNIYLDVGDGASAEKELQHANELGIPDATVRVPMGRAYLFQGQFDRIIKEFHPDGRLSQVDNAWLHVLRGQAFLGLGRDKDAGDEFEEALKIKADFELALLGQAQLALLGGRADDARRMTKSVLTSNPNSPDAWSLLGSIELSDGKTAEAEAALSKAIEFRKYPTLDIAKRAEVRIQLKKYTDADADIQKLKQQGLKDHPYVNYIAGVSDFNQKKYTDALNAFQASYNSDESFLPTQLYLATTHFILGHREQALNFAQQIYSKAPGSLSAGRLLGAIQISRADFDQASEVLQSSLRASPNDTTILSMLASMSLLKGDAAKGVEYLKRLATLEPSSSQVQDMLMLSKLIAGQKLTADIQSGSDRAAATGDTYTREFLLALESFHNGKIEQALQKASELHQSHPDKTDPIKLMAACYIASGRWDKAKLELENALKIDPKDASVILNLAKIEGRAGNQQHAKSLLDGLLKEQPRDEAAALLLAQTEARLGDKSAAHAALQAIIQNNPKALMARAQLAAEWLESGQIGKVLELTNNLTSDQYQKQPALFEVRGKALMLSGDPNAARTTFAQWTRVVPSSAQAHFLYSDSLARTGDAKKAREELKRALKLDPRYLPARIGEVKMYVQLREMDKAKKALAKLDQDYGDRSEVTGIRGWFALGSGDYASAEKYLSATLQRKPDAELTTLLVKAQWAQKKYDQALKVMQEWLKVHPQDLAVLAQLANAYMTLDKRDEALATYTTLIKSYPNYVPALNDMAWLNRDKDPKKAMEFAEQAYRIAPGDPYVMDTLGMLTLKSGDASRAYTLIHDAAKQLPTDPQIQLHLGKVLIQQSRPADARAVLEGMIKKSPGSPAAAEAKVLLESLQAARH